MVGSRVIHIVRPRCLEAVSGAEGKSCAMGGELSIRADMSDRKGTGRRPSRMLNLCLEVGRSEVVTNPEA